MPKEDDEDLEILLDAGFGIMLMLMVMLKWKIILKLLENIEALHIETVTSALK